MADQPQSYANHARIDPWYHYGAFGLLTVAFFVPVIRLFRHPGQPLDLWPVVISLGVLITWLKVRTYALRVQDRIIRLEETLRMQALLPEELKGRISELKPGQFVALRFAADAELAHRMAEALKEDLKGGEIKKRIQNWRADTFRV
jgi:hypothetical protein